ncbi:anthocyanidin 3-O-glucoside 2'''-O-xylosyltransferase-like [Prosopis cineraria]|uniref:anthocyanidin 3-O-glucoside 2'''-O-xylosyltransferase-like n=1 Tax=Prosopis cineraria TaxID=364024 RepID=UPI0024103BB0|nr:anthocyanidin 3-O-glucoside 2'''-O-xylosyltransferase-like [Prosopis cineraria]
MADLKFQIVMFPWFAAGHMTPFLHLANELAKRGHRITYLLPKKALVQLGHLNRHPDLVTFRIVTIPHVAGLPEGTETASEIPLSLNHLLCTATDKIQDQVVGILRETKPDLVVYDNAFWVPELARKLGIKTVCFNVVCAASLAIGLVPARKVPKDRALTLEDISQPPPGYPSTKVILRGDEARSLLFLSLPFGDNITFYDRITNALRECDAIAIRTCREIERSFCDYMSHQYHKPVFLTGPVLPHQSKHHDLDPSIATWLAGFEPRSVVFCAFGSQLNLEKPQFQEILLGLELTGLPFLVSLKPPMGCDMVDEALPEGFEERVGGRGMVCRGWVQQPQILDHPTVGCFVNHCGFGSMWESLMSEKQIVLCPHLGDQILNTRILVEELAVAVEVEKAEKGWISKEKLCEAVKKVMDEGSDVARRVRENHEEWRLVLGTAGFTDAYIDGFVHNLRELLRGEK